MTVADEIETDDRQPRSLIERVERALVSAWHWVVSLGAAIMPAWPLWGGVLLCFLALFLTGQGRQALVAVLGGDRDARLSMFAITFAFFALHSFSVCVGFLEATRHRDEVRGESLRRHRLRRRLAVVTALILPFVLLVFSVMNLRWQTGTTPYPAILAASLLLAFLAITLPFFALRFFRVKDTAFGQIATLDGKATNLLTFVGVAGAIFAAVAGYVPAARNAIGPVSIFLLAVTVYGLWMTRVVAFIRLRHLPPIAVLIVIFLIVGVICAEIMGRPAYHAIATIKSDDKPAPIDEMATAWLRQRSGGEGDIRAIIVLAEGGGLYAAHNAATSLAKLDQLSGDAFYNDVYAMSGVSGGSVGIAAYLAARADIKYPSDRIAAINKFMSSDFLSPLAAGLLFRDIPFRLTPPGADLAAEAAGMPREDRARLFEQELSRQWRRSCGENCEGRFDQSLFGVTKAQGPVILLNAAREADGRVETISNASFGDDSGLANLLDRYAGRSIPLGAAAHVSARFPIISPRAIAELRENDKKTRMTLVDGGYADNSGATAATHAVEALQRQAEQLGLADRLKIVVLHYYSRAITDEGARPLADRVDVLAELSGPVRAALAVQARRSAGPVEILCRSASPATHRSGEFCRALTASRKVTPLERKEDPDGIAEPRTSGGVTWIRAPLDIAVRANDPAFVPLGWHLGGAGAYVAQEANCRGAAVHDALAALAGESPSKAESADCTPR